MLRYYMHEGPTAFRFELAGALTTVDAAALDRDWRAASSILGNRTLILDLSFVTGIEQSVRTLFRRWHAAGAEFAATTTGSRQLVESITEHPFQPRPLLAPTYRPWFSLAPPDSVRPTFASSVVMAAS
jgi:hypothetical protein